MIGTVSTLIRKRMPKVVSRSSLTGCRRFSALQLLTSWVMVWGLSGVISPMYMQAQTPKYEMRGVWVTTVYNLDWPLLSDRGAPPAVQRASMEYLFDELERTGMNTVFFQVRSEADAMYASSYEPWSRFLTGTQGQAPSPFWDPLEEAIRLAHERGMELHAWLNPFRAVSDVGSFGLAANHILNTHPEWVLDITYKGTNDDRDGTVLNLINPGIPAAREYIVDVVEDIVGRYAVDGIHFDDYFYPYPPFGIGLEDEDTYNQFGSGYPSIEVWRRDNINQFMSEVQVAIEDIDPGVRFGVSPFGIWQNGVPQGIVGLDAYNVIYADPLTWFFEESIDYLVPQLYWPFGGGQDFGTLAEWWASEGDGIHIYPGIAAYRADPTTSPDSNGDGIRDPWDAFEIPSQISFGRTVEGIQGNVFFRARNLGPADNQGLTDRLATDFYRHKAITPIMPYKNFWQPESPSNLQVTPGSQGRHLRWDPPLSDAFARANRFAIYRAEDDGSSPDALAITNNAANLIHISWEPEWTDTEALEVGSEYHYVVTGLTPNSYESVSPELETILIESTAIEAYETTPTLGSIQIYPNPTSSQARIVLDMDLPAEVEIRVYDILGREVARPLNGEQRSAGNLEVPWDLNAASGGRVAPGVYQVVIRTGRQRVVRSLVVLR